MKHSIFIIALLISLKGFSQFEYIDQSNLYKKYSIQEVNAYDNDSGQIINDERWLIDKKGRIYSYKLLETKDDSTFSLNIYFFENDLLTKVYDIGIWNTRTNKVDTVTTIYIFNENKQVVRSIYSSTRNSDTLKNTYKYNDNLLIKKTFYDSYSRIQAIDSTFYYTDLTPHIEKRTFFSPEFGSDIREPISSKLTYYDTTGTVNLELEFTIDNNGQSTPVSSKSFVFKNGKLTEIIQLYLGTHELWGSKMRKTVEHYYYDSKGLVIRKEWFSDYKTEPYLVYTYDYK